MLRRKFYPSGALKIELNDRNGTLHGAARQYYENGQLQIDMNYEHGIPNGPYTMYYEAGNPQIETTLKDGKVFGKVQRYKGDGTPVDAMYFEEAAEYIPPVVADFLVPWEGCFRVAIRSSLGLLMTETAWSEGFNYEQDGQNHFVPIIQHRTPEQADTELQNGDYALRVSVNRSPWSDPIIICSGCSREKIGFDLSRLVADSVRQFREDYHDTLEYAGLLQQGYGFSITLS